MFSCGSKWERKGLASVFLHPAVLIVIVALAIRFILAPLLTYEFDIYHWGVIIQNIQCGNGLYEVAGYYYTPVWGYLIGLYSAVQDALMNLDVFGLKFTALLPVEDLLIRFHTSTITNPEFNVVMKLPMIVCDAIVAGLLYWLVMERTNNVKKASFATLLWMFCPTVIYMSGVQAMFDSFSAMMMLLTIILLYKDRTFLAGMMFAAATLLKFFPAFCILVLVGYLFVKHREDGQFVPKVLGAVFGAAIMAAAILLPQILDGTIVDTLSFVTGRVEGTTDPLISMSNYLGMFFMIASMLFAGYRMFKTEGDPDKALFENVLLAFAMAMITALTPQYMIVFMPFLILQLLVSEGKYRICWILISAGSLINALAMNNMSLLLSMSEYIGLISPETVLAGMQLLDSTIILGNNIVTWFSFIGGTIECIGIILIPVLTFHEWIGKRISFVNWIYDHSKGWYVE